MKCQKIPPPPPQTSPEISIVIPAHNEETNINLIFTKISEELSDEDFEVIFVDDGSRDQTVKKVLALKNNHANIKLVKLSRNFGHQAALMAGITSARGRAIITMDCDMQHPPNHLPKMIAAWRRGHKIVQMVRDKTIGIRFLKNVFSKLFYYVINLLSEYPIVPGVADFQLLDRHVADQLIKMKGRQPFIRGMVSWLGFNPITINYIAADRASGEASYSFWQNLWLAKTALFSMSRVPLRLGIYFGMFVAILCLMYIFYSIIIWFNGEANPGWTSLMVVFLFVGAVQIIIQGVIGEYIGQIYDSARNLPTYAIYPDEDEQIWSEEIHKNKGKPEL